jgi:hypothetical protein
MTQQHSITKNVLPGVRYMRRNLLLLLGIIWCCSLLAAGYVYFSNTGFIDFRANVFSVRSPSKIGPDLYNSAKEQAKKDPSVQDAYLLVLYNTKLMLTRYTGLDTRTVNGPGQVSANQNKTTTPVIIKRPASTQAAQNDDFSVKPFPK